MKGIFLDYASIDTGDLERHRLAAVLEDWRWHGATDPHQVAERIRDADVVVSNKVPLDRELLSGAPQLKLICIAATGTDKIDLEAARELGILVSNVVGYATPAVVQHVFSLLLALSTRLIPYHQEVRAGEWQAQGNFCLLNHPISEIRGKTLGILGAGELGQAVARVAECFGMRPLFAQRPGSKQSLPGRIPLQELLPQADVLSLHLPLADNTRNLMGARELGLMKPGAILINTARGGIVDEMALAQALRNGHLGGAGIDVLAQEPPANDNPLLAGDIPNLILTPHTAWASRDARQRLLDEIAQNITAFRQGKPRNCVDCLST
ncbi:2-hydroxyacid dehydrogenase [Thiolapillus brandeum]|uniref:Glycerate dehydrogenase n=1 Tax=Thiolapillus brandeum TaxID=1076588 RepID=A0A7U6JGI6_9GAMM|nr:2-hydroxyacid dehydrogenase [Thiolapillus brandeum]BAO42982.1 glycerate dehydrogenase [Thiolapillus brandeum]